MTKTYLNANRYMFLFKFTDITLAFSMPNPLSTSVHLIAEWGLDGDISWTFAQMHASTSTLR